MQMKYMIGAGALALMSAQAGAQTVAPPPSPSERARPEFDPVGGRVGSFILHPRADVTIEYDDNVLATPDGTQDDVILSVRPMMEIQSLWDRHRLEASAYLYQTVHMDLSSEDDLEAGARVAGVLDIDRDSSLRASASYDALAEERFRFTSPNAAAEPVNYSRLAANLSYGREVGDLTVGLDARANRLDFQDTVSQAGAPIDQDFRDSIYLSGAARVAHRIGPGISALVRGQVDTFDYTDSDAAALQRDSTGMRAEGGVSVELSRLIIGEVRAGYMHRWSDDPQIGNFSGLSFGAALTWTVTPLTTVRFSADREIEEGGSRLTAGNLRSQGLLQVEHELLRRLVLNAEARAAKIEPVGALPDAWEFGGELAATYYINRNLRLIGRVQHFQRDGSPPFFDISQNRALLTVRMVL